MFAGYSNKSGAQSFKILRPFPHAKFPDRIYFMTNTDIFSPNRMKVSSFASILHQFKVETVTGHPDASLVSVQDVNVFLSQFDR
jgi:hypothetical protein